MADGTRRWADQFKWIHNPNRSEGSVIAIGDSNQRLPVKAASRPMAQFYVTSALTSGTVDILKIDWTQTANTTGYQKGIRCTITSDYSVGSSCKAIYGAIDLNDTGSATGYVAALAGDATMPNQQLSHGGVYCLDLQLMGQTSTGFGTGGPAAFIRCALGATGAAAMQANAYLFDLQGLGAATAGEIFDTCVATPPTHSLKIQIGTTKYYILLTNNVDDT